MPNKIDPNAMTPDRIRRNFQRLARGASTSAITLGTNSGLQIVAGALSIDLGTNPGLQLLAAGISILLNGASLSLNASGLSIASRDFGDITTTTNGTVWTIDAGAVTYAKIQNVSATDRLLGRQTAGAGTIEEITCTGAGRALIDDADAAAQRTTLGLGTIATQNSNNVSITGGSITTLTALSVSGNFTLTTAGNGILIKEGTNATMGISTLVAGTVVVNTTKVTATSRIFLTGQNSSGTAGELTVSARTAATSFTITSASGADTRDVAWVILEPAP